MRHGLWTSSAPAVRVVGVWYPMGTASCCVPCGAIEITVDDRRVLPKRSETVHRRSFGVTSRGSYRVNTPCASLVGWTVIGLTPSALHRRGWAELCTEAHLAVFLVGEGADSGSLGVLPPPSASFADDSHVAAVSLRVRHAMCAMRWNGGGCAVVSVCWSLSRVPCCDRKGSEWRVGWW